MAMVTLLGSGVPLEAYFDIFLAVGVTKVLVGAPSRPSDTLVFGHCGVVVAL